MRSIGFAVALFLICNGPVRADLAHWFYQAKIDLGKERIYDVDAEGVPLAEKRQGRSRRSAKMFGLLDVKGLKVCLPKGGWASGVYLQTRKGEQRFDFLVSDCVKTRIRVHFNRDIQPSDYDPAAIKRYLSGIFEIHGFGMEGLISALGSATTQLAVQGKSLRIGNLALENGSEYQQRVQRYGGGLRLRSAETKSGGKRHLWSTILMARPMTPDEATLGAGAVMEQFRRDQQYMLNATFGKKLKKKLEIQTGLVQGRPHLSVQHVRYSYRRRDYLFDDTSKQIYYFESIGGRGKKNQPRMDAAINGLLASAQFHVEDLPATVLSSLTEIPEADVDDLAGAPSDEEAALAGMAAGDSSAAEQPTYDPAIKIVTVAVQPAEVSPGGELKLVIQYEVEGLPPGIPFEVDEQRQLVLDGAAIAAVEETISRTAGTYLSSHTIRAPADARSGVYTFAASVSLAGVSAEGSALFRVR